MEPREVVHALSEYKPKFADADTAPVEDTVCGRAVRMLSSWVCWQSFPQFAGLATTACPFLNSKTSLGQYSTQCGFQVLAQPSHLSEMIIGNMAHSCLPSICSPDCWIISFTLRSISSLISRTFSMGLSLGSSRVQSIVGLKNGPG
jgi:hypothetical protein